jgi:hypothetical protein
LNDEFYIGLSQKRPDDEEVQDNQTNLDWNWFLLVLWNSW